MAFIVALDGPAGSGKGTVTKILAQKLGLINIDTGAMYRCVALEMLNKNIKLDELDKIKELLNNIDISLKETKDKQIVLLNGQDVSSEIRTTRVTEIVSPVSSIKEIREKLVDLQRKMAKSQDVIMEGRDITTVVFPNADVKIYLDANVEERAKRRYEQNIKNNIESTYEQVLIDMKARDENDRNKEYGALKIAKDAIVIDSSKKNINQVVSEIKKIINKKKKEITLEEKAYKEMPDSKKKTFWRKFLVHFVHFLYRIVFRIENIGEKGIPEDEKSYIVCANHLNYLDAIAVITSSNRFVRFMCKSSMFKNALFTWVLHIGDVIPVNREKNDIEAMKRSIKALKNGEVLGIFPEGTRKGMEKNLDAKNGAAFMALRTKTKVIPIGIQGTFKPFTKVYLNYGKPLDFSEYYGKEKDKEVLNKVTKEIMDNIIMLTNEKK